MNIKYIKYNLIYKFFPILNYMIKYLLYLILVLWVIKMYNLNKINNVLYASISIILGVIIINWLFPDKIMNVENFTDLEIINVTPQQISGLSTTYINQILPNQIYLLTQWQVAGLTTDQIISLDKTKLFNLRLDQLLLVTPGNFIKIKEIFNNNNPLIGITPNQSPPPQLILTPIAVLNSVNINNYKNLSQNQIAGLTPTQVSNLRQPQMKDLSPLKISAFSVNTISSLHPTIFTGLTINQISALRKEQLQQITKLQAQEIDPAKISAINPYAISSTFIKVLSPLQISALTPLQISTLDQEQINSLDKILLSFRFNQINIGNSSILIFNYLTNNIILPTPIQKALQETITSRDNEQREKILCLDTQQKMIRILDSDNLVINNTLNAAMKIT